MKARNRDEVQAGQRKTFKITRICCTCFPYESLYPLFPRTGRRQEARCEVGDARGHLPSRVHVFPPSAPDPNPHSPPLPKETEGGAFTRLGPREAGGPGLGSLTGRPSRGRLVSREGRG